MSFKAYAVDIFNVLRGVQVKSDVELQHAHRTYTIDCKKSDWPAMGYDEWYLSGYRKAMHEGRACYRVPNTNDILFYVEV